MRDTNRRYARLITYLKQLQYNRTHAYDSVSESQPRWDDLARDNQRLPHGDWRIWLILAGRGFGKTRTGAQSIKSLIEQGYRRIALIGGSLIQARSIMIEGVSGLLAAYDANERPEFCASKREIHFKNGAVAMLFGGDQADQLRGPQFDCAWVDELAKFRQPEQLMEQLLLSLRLGRHPKCIITTTPRPIPIINKILKEAERTPNDYVITRGTTFENKDNLAPSFIDAVVREFDGTKLGSQELYGEILNEIQGALWQRASISYAAPPVDEDGRLQLDRIVVAIDPATTHHAKSDETGIVVVGIGACAKNPQSKARFAYVLEDLSGRHSPLAWGQRAVDAYHRYHADRIIAETNKGGDLVERIVRSVDTYVAYKEVRATRGKSIRAEPIAALYERGCVYHARPLHKLEEQMCAYVPGVTAKSPDRIDALVWGLTELMLENEARASLKVWSGV